MLTSDNLKDYILIDAGNKEKLESWNGIILRRPDPMALWPTNTNKLWDNPDGFYHRSSNGGGSWTFNKKLKESWTINYRNLKFKVSPTNFKHTGIFPEQASNWDFIFETIYNSKDNDFKVLNMFAYSGIATMVASSAGASEVVHVDASKGMISWAKDNQNLSSLNNNLIRYINEDCNKFMLREIRRNRKYKGIIMDPPSYGRGPNNELFKFEDQINNLLDNAFKLLDKDASFLILNTYTTGYSTSVLTNLMNYYKDKYNMGGKVLCEEIGIKIKDQDKCLSCGFTTRWYK